jgi:hypothetical protein
MLRRHRAGSFRGAWSIRKNLCPLFRIAPRADTRADLELRVNAAGKDIRRAAIGIVARIADELIIDGRANTASKKAPRHDREQPRFNIPAIPERR